MSTKAERAQEKKMVQLILGYKKEDYEEWLHKIHKKFVSDNQEVIFKGLEKLSGVESKQHPIQERGNTHETNQQN